MKFKFIQLGIFLLFIFSCGDDEELNTNMQNDLLLNSTSAEYDFLECSVRLSGSFQGLELLRSELGFVYSFTEVEPTTNDSKIEFFGSTNNSVFNALVTDYTLDSVMYWRSYTIYNEEVFYGSVMTFSEELTTRSSSFFRLSFDCFNDNKILQINREVLCPQWNYSYSICLSSVDGADDCLEFPMTNDRISELEIEENIVRASIFVFPNDNPEDLIFSDALDFPKTVRVLNEDLSDAPFAAAESTSFQIGEYLYVCGGYTDSASDYIKDLWRYEFAANEWTQLEDFPGTARAFMISFVKDNIAYVGSGGVQTLSESDFYSYNPSTNEWTKLADLPVEGIAGVAFALEDYAYVTNLTGPRDPSINITNQVYRYNFSTDTWTTRRQIEFNIDNARNMAVSHKGKGYLVNTTDVSFTIHKYIEEDDNWETLHFARLRCDDGVAVVANNSLFIASGRGMDRLYEFNLDTYNSINHCTSTLELRSEAVAGVFDNKIIISGGLEHSLNTQQFTKALNTVYSLVIPQ